MKASEDVRMQARAERLHLHSRGEAQDFIIELLQQARRKISIFAPTLDSHPFNTSRALDILASFTTLHRNNLARFLVEDADQSLHNNGRVVELCRRFSDFIKMRQIDEDHMSLQEMFITIDDRGYLHQPHVDRPEYLASPDAKSEARRFAIQYERMWERSQAISGTRSLGL